MADIEFGAEIAVDGKRPAWLEDQTSIFWKSETSSGECAAFQMLTWGYPFPPVKTIRLAAGHPQYQREETTRLMQAIIASNGPQPATQTLTAQEHLERLEAFVRKAAAHVSPMAQYSAVRDHLGEEARALVAEMEPVDPDLIEARKIATEIHGSYDYTKADCDDWPICRSALAAIKRGRELARGDVA